MAVREPMGDIPVSSLYTMSSSQDKEGALHGLHGTGKCWRLSRDMQIVQFGSCSGYAYFDVGCLGVQPLSAF